MKFLFLSGGKKKNLQISEAYITRSNFENLYTEHKGLAFNALPKIFNIEILFSGEE